MHAARASLRKTEAEPLSTNHDAALELRSGQPLKEAHEDLKAQHYVDAISTLTDVETVESRTPYDKHLINEMLAYAYIKTGDYAKAATAWETELNDGFTTESESEQKIRGGP